MGGKKKKNPKKVQMSGQGGPLFAARCSELDLVVVGLGDLAVLPLTPASPAPEQRQQREAQRATLPT